MPTRSVLILAALLAVGMASATQAPAAGVDGVPGFGHVFLIVGENTSFRQVSPRNAPYLTGTVIPNGAWLTNYPGLTDGSLGDYAEMVSGQFIGARRTTTSRSPTETCPASIACHQTSTTCSTSSTGANVPWQDGTSRRPTRATCSTTGTTWSQTCYVSHHSPALYFDDIQANHCSEDVVPSPECRGRCFPPGAPPRTT